MAILAVTALVSYERAKAESLGLSAKGGLMERGERMFLLGVAFLSTVIFVPVLWVLFVLVSFTAIARFVKVWNAASGRDAVIRRRIEAWREGRVDSRWRTWRESARSPPARPPPDCAPAHAPLGRPRRPLAGPPPGGAEQPLGPDPARAPPRRPRPHGHGHAGAGDAPGPARPSPHGRRTTPPRRPARRRSSISRRGPALRLTRRRPVSVLRDEP